MTQRFSWILPQKLAVGSFPNRTTSASMLRRQGVTAILCLTEEAEKSVPSEIQHNFVWQRVPIPDGFNRGETLRGTVCPSPGDSSSLAP